MKKKSEESTESSEYRQRSNAMSFTFCMFISFLVSFIPILGPIIFAFITGRTVTRRKVASKWAYLRGIIIGEMLCVFFLYYLFLYLPIGTDLNSLFEFSVISLALTVISFIIGVYCEMRSKKLKL